MVSEQTLALALLALIMNRWMLKVKLSHPGRYHHQAKHMYLLGLVLLGCTAQKAPIHATRLVDQPFAQHIIGRFAAAKVACPALFSIDPEED
jgi:hypothetical protein